MWWQKFYPMYVREVITLYLYMSRIGYVELIRAKIKFTHGILGGGGLSLRVYVYVCVNYVTHVLFESCFERMCKASFLRGAF